MLRNVSDKRKESINAAKVELKRAAGAFKEAIMPPKDDKFSKCLSHRIHMSEKYPEFDWFTKNKWEDFEGIDLDTRPLALQENFKAKKIAVKKSVTTPEKNDAASIYTKIYASFSGHDIVPVINGEAYGEIQSIRKNVGKNLEGYLDFKLVRYDRTVILPEETLIVLSYANEYGDAAYEVLTIGELLRFKTEDNVDYITTVDMFRYSGKILQPMIPVPNELRVMTNEDFKSMVAEVHAKCPEKLRKLLPKEPKTTNSLAFRTYYWILKNHFIDKEDAE